MVDIRKQLDELAQFKDMSADDTDFRPRTYEDAVAFRAERRRNALANRRVDAQRSAQQTLIDDMPGQEQGQFDYTTEPKHSGAYYRNIKGQKQHSGAYFRRRRNQT